ncbi:MAG: hypothetical protein GY780_01170 [bacterium]|nr:hypothetical protein [bacterium]
MPQKMFRSFFRQFLNFGLFITISAGLCSARSELPPNYPATEPDGIHVLDGSFVLNMGQLHVNFTNHGLIGSLYNASLPFSHAPSAQWPGGSGNEYLWGGGLWVGARVGGELTVSTGLFPHEFRPGSGLHDTMYEAIEGRKERPHSAPGINGRRLPHPNADDDNDQSIDEDRLNGLDDDNDGQIDEDFGQIGDQMFVCTFQDDLPLIRELYPNHLPIGLTVVQRAATWSNPLHSNIVALDFEITNTSGQTRDDIYLGFYADFDVESREDFSDPNDLAGFFDGGVRGEDGSFYRINLAYALDAADSNPLPGCIGLMTLHHTTHFRGDRAPRHLTVNSFQIFTSHGQSNQNGEPEIDQDRYYYMSRNQHDANLREDQKNDVRVLVSSGPFNDLRPGKTLEYELALVVGYGLQGALETAVEAARLGRGTMVNADNDWNTGRDRKESKICPSDFPHLKFGENPLLTYRELMMDSSCTGTYPVFGYELVNEDDLFIDENYEECAWVNTDNCDECFRALGHECTEANNFYWDLFEGHYSMYRNPEYFTGVWGRETRMPWVLPRAFPPTAPNARVVPGNHQVEILWDDSSQYVHDPVTGILDFESFRVWKASNWVRPAGVGPEQAPPHEKWSMEYEIDLINIVPAGMAHSPNDLPLGQNTGLHDSIYYPVCLADPANEGLQNLMTEFVAADSLGNHLVFPPIRTPGGAVRPGLIPFVPWETQPSVLDTFFAVTAREANEEETVIPKHGTVYYHYIADQLPNGFPLHFSVTATDHTTAWTDDDQLVPTGPGLDGEPANSPMYTVPRPDAQTPESRAEEGNNIYVYPNPATRESLAEFLGQSPSRNDPTGVRVMFNNLPEAHNTIRVFTTAGDLVQTIDHNGYTDGGQASWNLMSRNGQEVFSGIYLYSVHSDRAGFDDFRGRFVVIR